MEKVSEILDKAADYLETHGKCELMYEDAQGRVCAAGAIIKVTGDRMEYVIAPYPRRGSVLRALAAVIGPSDVTYHSWRGEIEKDFGMVTGFSDTHNCVEVVETMRKAAHFVRLDEEEV